MVDAKIAFQIRQSKREDESEIIEVHKRAFNRDGEAQLVLNLLRSDAVIEELSLVAVVESVGSGEARSRPYETDSFRGGTPFQKIVGHVLFSKVSTIPKHSSEATACGAIALAPLAVLPEFQKRGIGNALCTEALARAHQHFDAAIVLGAPEYYQRFGFETAAPYGIISPFEVEDKYFMVKPLSGFKSMTPGKIKYHQAFEGVD